jgi:hypothetical protein
MDRQQSRPRSLEENDQDGRVGYNHPTQPIIAKSAGASSRRRRAKLHFKHSMHLDTVEAAKNEHSLITSVPW